MNIKEFLEANELNMIEDLKTLVSFNSVYSDDAKPFGSQNQKVLESAIEMMDKVGLKTANVDYYAGYGEMGEGDKLIGILTHLDIVPAGEGWHSDPFKLYQKDGMLYGRGVSDDKGAFVASLYALKYLKETAYPLKKRLRLICGCNEETGSKCIEHYVKKEGAIDLGFTPDGNFPGICGEKGVVRGKIRSLSNIINISGGEAENVVCKRVDVELKNGSYDESSLNEYFRDNDITYTIIKSNESIRLSVFGKAAHASMPDDGINAIAYLMEGLYRANYRDELVSFFHDKLALDNHGKIIKADQFNDELSDLTLCIGTVRKVDQEVVMSVDVRSPLKTSAKEVAEYLNKKLNLGNNHFEITDIDEPLYFDTNSPMLKALLKSYQDVMDDKEAEMEVIGGGTYAKAMPNCIAFGCEFPGFDAHIHDIDEVLSLEHFKKQVEIYVEAIKNLNEVA